MELKDGDYRVPVRGKTTRIHYMELKAVRLAIGLMCIVLQESITWSCGVFPSLSLFNGIES